MVILENLELESATVVFGEGETIIGIVILRHVFLEPILEQLQQGGMTGGTFPVGSPGGIHLEEAEIHPKLDFFDAVLGRESSDHHLPGLVIPGLENM